MPCIYIWYPTNPILETDTHFHPGILFELLCGCNKHTMTSCTVQTEILETDTRKEVRDFVANSRQRRGNVVKTAGRPRGAKYERPQNEFECGIYSCRCKI